MRWLQYILAALVALFACASPLKAQRSPLFGDWQEPAGSVLHIGPCSDGICLWIAAISAQEPTRFDAHNPDPAQRTRSLCRLQIGSGFQLSDAAHAVDGRLYDPKSGRTYRGNIAVEGNTLKLRGYIGAPMFGRSETWHRVVGTPPACTQ